MTQTRIKFWRISAHQVQALACEERKCTDQGCELKGGSGIRNCYKINTEKYWIRHRKAGRVTDFLVLCAYSSRKKIVMVEMKSNRPDIPQIIEKFQCVCSMISEFIDINAIGDYDFYPVMLSKSMPPEEARQLRAAPKITLGNKAEKIISEHCGDSLDYIFNKYN